MTPQQALKKWKSALTAESGTVKVHEPDSTRYTIQINNGEEAMAVFLWDDVGKKPVYKLAHRERGNDQTNFQTITKKTYDAMVAEFRKGTTTPKKKRSRAAKTAVILLLASFLTLSGFQVAAEKDDATVEQQEGLYIFVHSKPKRAYEYLGSVKKNLSVTGQPDEMLPALIRKAKKEHPDAEAIIITSMNMEKADAIKFK